MKYSLPVTLIDKTYKNILKPLLFTINPEFVHEYMTTFGENLGKSNTLKQLIKSQFEYQNQCLHQQIKGIHFKNPIGLSAGFDYDARLTQILPSIGFGFGTVGTITLEAYGGNARPILGRLPKSNSLMVNKGFKNQGITAIVDKLSNKEFDIPIGISIGRTNTLNLKNHEDCINDIVSSFLMLKNSNVLCSYYELNISCPNIAGNISFYNKEALEKLLSALDTLSLPKPLFIKMPIECDDETVKIMLDVAKNHSVAGVIFGNLQKNRQDSSLDQSEVSKFKKGNFSGKPTEQRSNELISLTYRNYKDRFIIIGCGGVFSAEDAYEKIKRGATLIQLITGMIYNGPQLIYEINKDLVTLLQKDGYTHISQAIGSAE